MRRRLISIICFLILITGVLAGMGIEAHAENTVITLEASEYDIENNGEIVVTVYFNSDTDIGAYHAEVKYDSYRLEYIGGGDSADSGK